MNILVIGLGSMGKRRIRLIKEMYPNYTIVGVDGRKDRREEASSLFGISVFESIGSAQQDVSCAFVCTSPLSHAAIITECLGKGWHVFTELNLVDTDYIKNLALAKEKHCTIFLSSTFLYREEVSYISSQIDNDHNWNYIYHIGQYLPDWHPWESYNEFFVGTKQTNGCREILAIELPWIIDTFGAVEKTHVFSDKMTGLKIDFRDNYLIQLVHENGNKGVLIVDVVSPVAVRKLEVYSEHKYLSWNGTPDSLFAFDDKTHKLSKVALSENAEHIEGYSSFIIENAYKKEIKEFFDVVQNDKPQRYGFEKDLEVLHLIDSIGA